MDVENSRDVTDNGVQYICMFKLSQLNIFNCSLSVQGLAAIVQTNHSLREPYLIHISNSPGGNDLTSYLRPLTMKPTFTSDLDVSNVRYLFIYHCELNIN